MTMNPGKCAFTARFARDRGDRREKRELLCSQIATRNFRFLSVSICLSICGKYEFLFWVTTLPSHSRCNDYFPPVVAIPSMNVRCARKNRISVGKQTSVDAAISNCHDVPPMRL